MTQYVFPLPVRDQSIHRLGTRLQPDAWTSTNPPLLPSAPLAVVPPASLPLGQASDGGNGTPQPAEATADAPGR